MSDEVCVVVRCAWCGRPRGFVGEPPARVFCRSGVCEPAQQLLDLVLEEERSLAPRPEFCVRVWDELERLTCCVSRGPRVESAGGQLALRVAP